MAGNAFKYKEFLWICVFLALSLGVYRITSAESFHVESKFMGEPLMINDKDFVGVDISSRNKTECSPGKPSDDDWEGILINAPHYVYLPAEGVDLKGKVVFGTIPICGYSMLQALIVRRAGPKIIVAEDIRTHKRMFAPLYKISVDLEVPPPNAPPIPDERLEHLVGGGYFYHNLLDHLDLPSVPATYNVHIELGEYISNTVTIQIVDAKELNK